MLPGYSPSASSLGSRLCAAASASTCASSRAAMSRGPNPRRRSRLRNRIIGLVLVGVRREPLALVFRGRRIVGEDAGRRGSEREIVRRPRAASQFLQELLEHRYLLPALDATTASTTAAAKKTAASSHILPISETAVPRRASTVRTDQRLPPSVTGRSDSLTASPRLPLVPRWPETAGRGRG